MPLSLTRIIGFRAEHHYGQPQLTAAENAARYGALTRPHPHDYRCAVTVTGPLEPGTGILIDLGLLDRLLDEEVGRLDGGNLNRDIPLFADGAQQPTCEALAAWLYDRIAPRLPAGVTLARLRIAEGPTLHADCTPPR